MLNILVILHIIISILLIIAILLQRTGTDSGIGGNNANFNPSSGRNPLIRITTILAVSFMINILLLNNLSTKKHKAPVKIFEETLKQPQIPIEK